MRERESENGKCLSEPPRSLSLSAHAPKTWRADDAVASKRLDVCVCVCGEREIYTRVNVLLMTMLRFGVTRWWEENV